MNRQQKCPNIQCSTVIFCKIWQFPYIIDVSKTHPYKLSQKSINDDLTTSCQILNFKLLKIYFEHFCPVLVKIQNVEVSWVILCCYPSWYKARCTRYKFCIQVSIQENLDQENLNSSLCIHVARNFNEYTQVLAGDTTNKMAFLGGEEGAALCIALLCTIVLGRRLSSKKRSTWARKWLRRQ